MNSIIVDRMREGGEAVRGRLHPSIREDGVLVCMQHSGRPGRAFITLVGGKGNRASACMHADADALVMGCWCTLAACLSMQQEAGRHYCAQAGIIVHAGKQKQDPALLHAEQQAAWKGEVARHGIQAGAGARVQSRDHCTQAHAGGHQRDRACCNCNFSCLASRDDGNGMVGVDWPPDY